MNLRVILFALFLTTTGCRHPIVIIGEGDVFSASGNRDCLFEAFQSNTPKCTENRVEGAYFESYYTVARPGYVFSGWGNYCARPDQKTGCSFDISRELVEELNLEAVPPLVAYFRKEVTQGHSAVLMGHSFFSFLYSQLESFAKHIGFSDHRQSGFGAGGSDGAPISLWEAVNTAEHHSIKGALDEGGVTLLGMTYYPFSDTEYNLQGYKNWIDYALRNNSDFDVFVGMPWPTNPGDLDIESFKKAYEQGHNEVHSFIDALRREYPTVDIFCVPYGESAVELKRLFENDRFPELETLIGPSHESVFSDELGHPGWPMTEMGTLIWLKAIYGVDLQEIDYRSPFRLNIVGLSERILNSHDHNYDAP